MERALAIIHYTLAALVMLLGIIVILVTTAKGAEVPRATPGKRALVVMSVATLGSNVADAEMTEWKLHSNRHFWEHDPLYGRRPGQARILTGESAGALVAVGLAWDLWRHGHRRLAFVPLVMTTGASLYWVQHNARWRVREVER
jgi:hypothetical protein